MFYNKNHLLDIIDTECMDDGDMRVIEVKRECYFNILSIYGPYEEKSDVINKDLLPITVILFTCSSVPPLYASNSRSQSTT